MQPPIRIIFPILFWWLMLPLDLCAQEELTGKADGISIVMPKGWDKLTEEELDFFHDQTPDSEGKVRFDFGMVLLKDGEVEPYPYMLLTVNHRHRISKPALRDLKSFDLSEYRADRADADRRSFLSLPKGVQFYDRGSRRIFTRHQSTDDEGQEVIGLSAATLTRSGFVEVYAFALREDFANHSETFINTMLSVSAEEHMAYDWDQPEKKSAARIIVSVFSLIVLVVVGAGTYFLFQVIFPSKKKSRGTR